MAQTPQHTEIEEDIYNEGEFEEDGTAAMLREMIDQMEEPEEDTGGLDQPIEDMPTVDAETVTAEEGAELISDAELGRKAPKKDTKPQGAAAAGDEGEGEAAKPDAAAEEKPDAGEEDGDPAKDGEDAKGEDLAASDLTSLLDGIDAPKAKELTRRVTQADGILKQFEGRDDELKLHGAKTPEDAIRGLLHLNKFAQEKTDEYLPWVAHQVTGGDPEKLKDLLTKTAERVGIKIVVPDEDSDDDLFEDEEVKALKDEVKRLRAAQTGGAPEFGPYTPERVQQATIQQTAQSFINEVDEAGQPKRPLLNQVLPQIAQRSQAFTQQTGRPPTIEDLDAFYHAEVDQLRSAFGQPAPSGDPAPPQDGSAAKTDPAVQEAFKKKAAAAERAKRASKSVDGTGQGASRRPSKVSQDAPLGSVISQFWDDLSG